ncbi:DUF1285 domain-containing protein [Metallumcola ferriviriculae]|uniref:DUF1285 domain-containing protein n=1 Tax=Metallumcola ferriviriculae TaxID=3039180 RepID=A0AAU0UH62_9FIRM|nr:DUF1285 domain-containing protein [Desulfitibacteraceae bacterium MK1]
MDNMVPITISKDGEWYYGNSRMFRLDIVTLLANHLEKDENGNYHIIYQEQVYPVTVEETPFFARRLLSVNAESLILQLADGRTETISAQSLVVNNNIPYGEFKWAHDTKFSRQALWDLSDYMEEGTDGQVMLKLKDKAYRL